MTEGERGSALLEVILLGLVLIVPLVWLLGVLAQVHIAALATDAAAREIGWELTRGGDPMTGVERATISAFADHGLDPGVADVAWRGQVERGAKVRVTASYPVALASFPVLGNLSQPVFWVRATHDAHVAEYRSSG
jgi:hypothetical protein